MLYALAQMLRVIERLRDRQPLGITSSYLAHAVPQGMTASAMTDEVLCEHLPQLALLMASGEISVQQVDVFCEKGFFDRDQSRKILEAGANMGLTPAFHGDELNDMGSGFLAEEVNARSVSHLEEIGDVGIAAMARTGTVGVLLPTTAFLLRLNAPPARAMIDGGVAVALGACLISKSQAYPVRMSRLMSMHLTLYRPRAAYSNGLQSECTLS